MKSPGMPLQTQAAGLQWLKVIRNSVSPGDGARQLLSILPTCSHKKAPGPAPGVSEGWKMLERAMGFEPTVSTLGRSHVTTTPSPRKYQHQQVYLKGGEKSIMVPPTGLEPARPKGTGPQPAAYTIPPRGLFAPFWHPARRNIQYIVSVRSLSIALAGHESRRVAQGGL